MIERIAPGQWGADKRQALRSCVANWELVAKSRARLFEAMARRGVGRKGDAVLVEVGGSGWGGYTFALAVDRVIQADILDGSWSASASRLRAWFTEPEGLRSHVDTSVDDGQCWFLTAMRNGRLTQVVQYGTLDRSGEAGELIREMSAYLQRPPIQLPKK